MIVLSDIHANLPAFSAVVDHVDPARAFFCGDLVGYHPWPDEVAALAREHDLQGVRGNHDEAVLSGSTFGFNGMAADAVRWTIDTISDATRDHLESLPYTRRETVDGRDVMAVHGSPAAPTEQYVHPGMVDADFLARQDVDVDVLLLGHTHVPFAKRVDGTLVVNPGSVGQPRDGDPRASYAELDLDTLEATIHRIDYPVAETQEAVRDAGLPERIASRLAEGR